MSHPFVDLAIGALRGYTAGREAARQRQREEEELAERRRRSALEEELLGQRVAAGQLGQLAELARLGEQPGVELGQPGEPGEAGETPFLSAALSVGGRQYNVRVRPGEAQRRQEATERAAYEQLHARAPRRYPNYVPGFSYTKELEQELENERRESQGTAQVRRALAEDAVADLLSQGKSVQEILAATNRDPQTRGMVTVSTIRRIQRELEELSGFDERKQAVKRRLGATLDELPPRIAQGLVEQLAYDDSAADRIPSFLQEEGVEPDVVDKVRRALYFGRFTKSR
jgi:hypothetical protein